MGAPVSLRSCWMSWGREEKLRLFENMGLDHGNGNDDLVDILKVCIVKLLKRLGTVLNAVALESDLLLCWLQTNTSLLGMFLNAAVL